MLASLLLLLRVTLAADHYVQGDVINVRAGPSAASNVRWRLRINTRVDVLGSADGWKRIRLTGRPDTSPVEGWVAGVLIGATPVDAAAAAEQAEAAWERGDRIGALRLAERAFAIDIRDARRARTLRELYAKLGRTQDAARVDSTHAATNGVWIGLCDGTRVNLVAKLDPGPKVHSLMGEAYRSNPAIPPLQQHVLTNAATMPWFVAGRDTSGPLPGTPFPRPFHTTLYNEQPRLVHEPEGSAPCMHECVVRLGACETAGMLYATADISWVPSKPVEGPSGALGKLVQQYHQSRWPDLRVFDAATHRAGPFRFVTGRVSGFDVAEPRPRHAITVLGPDNEPTSVLGAYMPAQHDAHGGTAFMGPPDAEHPRWVAVRAGGEQLWVLVLDISVDKSWGRGVAVLAFGNDGHHSSNHGLYEAQGG